ncbi:hypothetical protein P4O66_003652 [Electrophorus voltai]|uniref:Hemicentin-1 n=1 Tax=Electrophorus voltai TaxID=2609070 RepID=A0AAD9E2M6_9TELE|nr:hypothetical protein P4O66_003652 [Electrophorus voltai]
MSQTRLSPTTGAGKDEKVLSGCAVLVVFGWAVRNVLQQGKMSTLHPRKEGLQKTVTLCVCVDQLGSHVKAARFETDVKNRVGFICKCQIWVWVTQDTTSSESAKEQIPQGASTLAFVFDVTGSMYDDLVQVIEGASKILETSLSRPKRPLYNFALVPFHDPEIGPVTITTDPKKFQNELRELYVQGGGDCPEMSIGAIKIALEISLPGSFIYVFTDARSKDYKLTHEVLQLIQQKQSQVVFVLTGDCDDRSHIGYKVYEEIASTSSGQVFHLDKKQVNEVLKWVEEAVQSSKVHLLSTDHYHQVSNTWQIPFDPSLKEVTVALSGPDPAIEIRNPQGKLIGSKDGLTELLHIPNSARVLNLKDPEPGMWTIKTISEGRHSVRITGLSTIDFRAGFSRKHTLYFKMTSSRPVQGIPTFILLNTTGLSHPARADRLELLSITGAVMKTLPIRYYPDRKPYSIWNVTEFVPPDESFFLRVTGYDSDGFLFQRVSSVLFSSIVPDAPKVSMPSHTPGYYLQKCSITCYVDSLIPYILRFTREGDRLGVDQLFSESSNASWDIAEVSLKDEGFYDCIAISSAGTGRSRTFLDVSEPPPAIAVPSNVTASPGSVTLLTCVVASTVHFNLTWRRGGMDLRGDTRIRLTANLSLEIQRVTPDDAGWYNCVAANEGGVSTSRVYLSVQATPAVYVSPQNQTFSTGDEVWIRCSATGYPTPTLVWTHNDMFIVSSSRHRMTPDGALVIRKTVRKDAGTYGCLASNVAGTDARTVLLSYIEPPQVMVPRSRLLIGLGQRVVMECTITGIPQPEVLWYKGDQRVKESVFLNMDPEQGALSIQQTEDADAGDYICVAVNVAGTAQGKITLEVGSAPEFTRQLSDVAADIGSNITLTCHAQGHPEPRLTWRREDNSPLFSRRQGHSTVTQKRGGDLLITNLSVEDDSTFICEAQNQFGKIQGKARVTVTGLVSPVIALSPAEVSVIEEQQVTLPCVLMAGNPLPQRHWLHDKTLVTSGPYVSVRRDGSLHIERVTVLDGGEYTCTAENVAGSSKRTTVVHIYGELCVDGFTVQFPAYGRASACIGTKIYLYILLVRVQFWGPGSSLLMLPTIQHGPQVFSTIEGMPISLPCHAHGVPKPDITWSKCECCECLKILGGLEPAVHLLVFLERGEVLDISSGVFSLNEDGSLHITSPGGDETGEFVCTATSAAGYSSRKVQLTVYVRPRLSGGGASGEAGSGELLHMSVRVGDDITLPCEVQSVPPPIITWAKDKQLISPYSPRHTQLPSGSMKIMEAQVTDSGMYLCVATNIAGNFSHTVRLRVLVPPSILTGPRVIKVQVEHSIDLPCVVQGVPQPSVSWLKDGAALVAEEANYTLSRDGTLAIRKVALTHQGVYTCVASNVAGQDAAKIHLQVQVPPVVEVPEPPFNSPLQERVANQQIAFPCPAKGLPQPVIKWFRNGQQLMGGEPGVSILEDGTLLILASLSPLDNGEYTCMATNDAGSTQKKYQLRVNVPPEVRDGGLLSNVSVVMNQHTNLVCDVTGTPPPVIAWYKDGALVVASSNVQILQRGKTLRLLKAATTDSGHYSCKAINVAGGAEKRFHLDVLVPPTVIGSGGSRDISVNLSHEIILECKVKGTPFPAIQWYKDRKLVFLGDPNIEVSDQGQVLKIKSARLGDQARYQCSVTNSAGKQSRDFNLSVYVPPSIKGGNLTSEVTALLSNAITLKCEARGVPLPTITWHKDGEVILSSRHTQYVERGQLLRIPRVQASDAGRYTCKVTSLAGAAEKAYELDVYAGGSDVSVEKKVVAGKALTLACDANGHPIPSLTWLKDGSPVKAGESLQVLEQGRKIEILDTGPSDTGRYVCVATSDAGEAAIKYDVSVLVPPSVYGADESTDAAVIINNLLELECHATGTPTPTITWRKDSEPLRHGEGVKVTSKGHRLVIPRAQLSDTALFQCVAMNEAGEQERDFKVVVHVPPSIRSTGPAERSVILHNPTSLQCVASGVPAPSITWLKDGRPIDSTQGLLKLESAGRVLQIKDARLEDAGKYTCVATNAAGETQQHIRLSVHEPPSIQFAGETVNQTILVGYQIQLECKATGSPIPALTWYKDGRPLTSAAGVRILNRGQVLEIDRAQVSDAGTYKCVAVSIAGKAELTHGLQVYVPPSISSKGGVVTVVVNDPLRLDCEASGLPVPSLTWLKEGSPVSSSSNGVKVTVGGRVLSFDSAQVSDTGRYTCVAVNAGGEQQREYDLRVYGNPVPEITWLKDGQPVADEEQLQVMSHGRFLHVSSAQVADMGRYSCLASSSAGDGSAHFNLIVLISPSIAGTGPDGSSSEEVTVTLNSPTSLVCEAQSYPPAIITWLKDGTPFLSSRNVRVLPGGRTLQILNAQEEDAGRYTCVATNEAGETLKNYEVKVYIPPIISKDSFPGEGFTPREIKIKVNNTLTLECEAQAIPTPTLHWYKDGQLLKADGRVTVTANGRIVQIKQAQVSDTGRYTCIATNVAGEDEKDFDVNIQVPPSFGGNGDSSAGPGSTGEVKEVVLNNPISLYCETNAMPPPTLTWYKDRQPIISTDRVLILPGKCAWPGGRVLQIPRAQAEDSGRYTCMAINEAGEDSIQYDVKVLLPPTIRGADRDTPDEVTVLVNNNALLECHADGSPAPNISWLKDRQPLHPNGTHTLLSSGRTLQILNAQVTDTGRYACVADNVAGSAEKYFNLNVHVPPSIAGMSRENATVVVNNYISLSCETTGIPPPTLGWLKARRPVQETTSALIMPGGRTLQILKAKMSDGGTYSCVAINPAGQAQKLIYLTVMVKRIISAMTVMPPSFRDSSDALVMVSVRVGNSAVLECQPHAVPSAAIAWYKNGRLVTETTNLRILADGHMLEIRQTALSDTGQYVCTATNIAGRVEKNFHLNIHVPPSIDGPAEEQVVETISNPVTLSCDAAGIPPPSLTWIKKGRVIENSESLEMHILSGGGKLQIAHSQLSDSGTYTCLASNVEGKAHKSYHLTIHVVFSECNDLGGAVVPPSIIGSELPGEVSVMLNASVQLLCRVEGFPTPTIQWLKDGKALSQTDLQSIRISPDGSTLTVTATHTSNGGKYTCVATNSAGEEDRIFNLNVYAPPAIQGNGRAAEELSAVLDSSVSVECVASGSPPPQLSWLKNSLPLPVSAHIRLLSAAQVLRIGRVQVSDGGTYTCVASNRAGVDIRHYNLQVYVPPSLDGAGSTDNVTVVKGTVVALVCVSDGTPSPSLAWLKEGDVVPLDAHIALLNHNSTLQIAHTHVNHTGRYTCIARNLAGEARRHFSLKVLEPPRIKGSGAPTEVPVVVHHALELECQAEGIPTPTLTWLKDGRPLPQTDGVLLLRGGEGLRITSVQTSPRVRVLSGGRYLQINNADLGDTARYTCLASNVAGETTRHFNLSVNVAPTIKDGPQDMSVNMNQPVVLECVVSGVPAPHVTWRKHGAILSGNSHRYRFAEDGSLHIHSAQVTDTGRYLCMATNPAGTQRKRVDLQVYVPPSIAEGPTNVTVMVNVQTTLSCEATGIPKPSVIWTKDTHPLHTDQNQNMYRLLSSGSLIVIAPTVEDTALYECVVSNEAGQESRAIRLTIHVPPSIADEATELVVGRLTPVVLGCSASGVPNPVLHWTKDGMRLATEGEGYKILPSGPLEITATQLSHSGHYTCVAMNAAGSAYRHIQLVVQESPVIHAHPSTLDVILNNHVTLPCHATGTPIPTMTWQKEGINIDTSGGDFTVLPNGGLQISWARVEDSGTYMCVAQNPAGTALGKTKLRVQVPPVISSNVKSYTVAVDGAVTLQCQTEGYPSPSVSWHRNGQLLDESMQRRILSTGSLQLAFAQANDAGRYVCTATNLAGSNSLEMSLTVLVPPTIRGGEPELWVVENTMFTVAHRSMPSGLSSKPVYLLLWSTPEPPIIDGDAHLNHTEPLGGNVILNCEVRGDPPPTIQWSKNGISIQISDRIRQLANGSLAFYSTVSEDAGSPIFTVEPLDTAVDSGSTALLSCQAQGEPEPIIEWTRQGRLLLADERITTLPDGSLQLSGAQKEDTSEYECVARNLMGSALVRTTLTVREWGACSVSCGTGVQKRLRQCNNPLPANGGRHCMGSSSETRSCQGKPCPVDGQWTEWSAWDECSHTCGHGNRTRVRTCSRPSAQHGGRACVGRAVEVMLCSIRPCPVAGNWGAWLPWSPCSETCGTGMQTRVRLCNNPPPSFDGLPCKGADMQTQVCIEKTCPVDGNWGPWQPWGECSASCGIGERTRVRLCNSPSPSNKGRPCPGDSTQLSRCNIQSCPGGPQKARGSIIGNINNVEFGIAILNATISNSPSGEKVVQAAITNIPRSLGPAMRKLVSLLNPIYWTTAQELGEAINGYTLTNGFFRRETQVEFATGEILRMTHVVRGLDADGALLLDIVVNGHVLQLPSNADISVKDYAEDYIQTGPGQLYALSTRMFSVDSVSVPYSWNHTILYDPSRGKMPYLVQTLHASAISAQYRPLQEMLEFTIHATIAKGERSNQCPSGFLLDPAGPYCADENECEEGNPCSHTCHNSVGTYYCSCPRGLTISADGRTCQDIDECSLDGHLCHDGQDCENTIGSYRCVMRCGRGFRRTADGLSCSGLGKAVLEQKPMPLSDINECQDSNPCHQHCLNTIGSFRCACELGYQLRNRRCIDINECRQRVCRSDQQCKNTRGGYTCIDLCPTGMTKGANGTCVDINECRDGMHQCRYNQICENTRGSYHCTCPRGYRSQGVGRPCLDINECKRVPMPCAFQCVNSPGSYKCICPPGRHLLGDGKSCAGLERLPSYESLLYGFRTSQTSPEQGSYEHRYHSLASQSFHSYAATRGRNRAGTTPSRSQRVAKICPLGFREQGDQCIDINECEQRDTCQHECMNTPGSHKCLCPNGYRLMTNGKTCQEDIDECLEQSIQCGMNRMCFNMRGSFQCIDTPCPPNYQRDPATGFCLKNCPPNDLECALSPYALEYKLLSLPFGIAANQDLIRLVAYTQDGVVHPRTSFLAADEDTTLPFALRDENLKGVLFTTRPLREPRAYRMKVRALSYGLDSSIEYQTTFIVYIAVSAYPY